MTEDQNDYLLGLAWGVIANAGGGDWTTETPQWQAAAADWRDMWLQSISRVGPLVEESTS